jgi:hypothetical protein
LTIAEAQIAGPDAASAKPRLAELETEARARGFERIALKAAALAARPAPARLSGRGFRPGSVNHPDNRSEERHHQDP